MEPPLSITMGVKPPIIIATKQSSSQKTISSTHSQLNPQRPPLRPTKLSSAAKLSAILIEQTTMQQNLPQEDTRSPIQLLREEVVQAFKSPIVIIVTVIVLIFAVVGLSLLVMLLGGVRFENEAKRAMWIELLSQIINGISTSLAIFTVRQRLIPLRYTIKLLREIKSTSGAICDEELSSEHVENIKKYAGWYDHKTDPLTILICVLILITLNAFVQLVIACFMWGFSQYDSDDQLVFKMISTHHRPMKILYCFVAIAVTTSVVSGFLIISRVTKRKLATFYSTPKTQSMNSSEMKHPSRNSLEMTDNTSTIAIKLPVTQITVMPSKSGIDNAVADLEERDIVQDSSIRTIPKFNAEMTTIWSNKTNKQKGKGRSTEIEGISQV
ncbi:hypothetical protein G9A89_010433 [Geosiphon pyriformis]|nr:hypothetical protein G9A89_010433 [Geosiphon pyriformis]